MGKSLVATFLAALCTLPPAYADTPPQITTTTLDLLDPDILYYSRGVNYHMQSKNDYDAVGLAVFLSEHPGSPDTMAAVDWYSKNKTAFTTNKEIAALTSLSSLSGPIQHMVGQLHDTLIRLERQKLGLDGYTLDTSLPKLYLAISSLGTKSWEFNWLNHYLKKEFGVDFFTVSKLDPEAKKYIDSQQLPEKFKELRTAIGDLKNTKANSPTRAKKEEAVRTILTKVATEAAATAGEGATPAEKINFEIKTLNDYAAAFQLAGVILQATNSPSARYAYLIADTFSRVGSLVDSYQNEKIGEAGMAFNYIAIVVQLGMSLSKQDSGEVSFYKAFAKKLDEMAKQLQRIEGRIDDLEKTMWGLYFNLSRQLQENRAISLEVVNLFHQALGDNAYQRAETRWFLQTSALNAYLKNQGICRRDQKQPMCQPERLSLATGAALEPKAFANAGVSLAQENLVVSDIVAPYFRADSTRVVDLGFNLSLFSRFVRERLGYKNAPTLVPNPALWVEGSAAYLQGMPFDATPGQATEDLAKLIEAGKAIEGFFEGTLQEPSFHDAVGNLLLEQARVIRKQTEGLLKAIVEDVWKARTEKALTTKHMGEMYPCRDQRWLPTLSLPADFATLIAPSYFIEESIGTGQVGAEGAIEVCYNVQFTNAHDGLIHGTPHPRTGVLLHHGPIALMQPRFRLSILAQKSKSAFSRKTVAQPEMTFDTSVPRILFDQTMPGGGLPEYHYFIARMWNEGIQPYPSRSYIHPQYSGLGFGFPTAEDPFRIKFTKKNAIPLSLNSWSENALAYLNQELIPLTPQFSVRDMQFMAAPDSKLKQSKEVANKIELYQQAVRDYSVSYYLYQSAIDSLPSFGLQNDSNCRYFFEATAPAVLTKSLISNSMALPESPYRATCRNIAGQPSGVVKVLIALKTQQAILADKKP